MGRRADVLDAESSAQLTAFQSTVLSWSFYDLGGAADAARQAQLRDVPASFASFQARAQLLGDFSAVQRVCLALVCLTRCAAQEYLDVFEPLVLEECCAQVIRGGEARARPQAAPQSLAAAACRALPRAAKRPPLSAPAATRRSTTARSRIRPSCRRAPPARVATPHSRPQP